MSAKVCFWGLFIMFQFFLLAHIVGFNGQQLFFARLSVSYYLCS